MEQIIKKVRDSWTNPEELKKILVDIVEEYGVQAQRYADAVINEASEFNSEMEENFKPSVTKAEYRAKELVGGTKILAEREMKALELLFEAIQTVIQSSFQNQGPYLTLHEGAGTTFRTGTGTTTL